MAVHTITVQLNFNGRQMSVGLTGAQRDIDRFASRLRRLDNNLQESEHHARSWARVMRDSFIVLGLARSAFANVNAVLTAFPAAVIRASASIERMTVLMAGLDKQSLTTAEAMGKATAQVEELFKIAGQSPFSVDAVTDSFVKLKAAGIDPNQGGLQGLIDSIAKVGGSSDQLKRASIAIQQMAGKGVISMEELRQQLGEAYPEAMKAMVRATGYSMSELIKIISLGRLKAEGALAGLLRQMFFENFGSASIMAQTWTGTLQRLENEWTMFMARIGKDSGFYENMKVQIEKITAAFRSNVEIANLGRQMGQALSSGLSNLVRLIELAIRFKNELAAVARVMAVGFAAHFLHAPVAMLGILARNAGSAAIAMGTLAQQQTVLAAATTTLHASVSRLATSYYAAISSMLMFRSSVAASAATTGIATAAMHAAGVAVVAFGRAMFVAGTLMLRAIPIIGQIAMALWAVYEVYKLITGSAEDFNRVLKEQADQVDETGYQILLTGSRELDSERGKMQARINEMQAQWGSLEDLRKKVEDDRKRGGGSAAFMVNAQKRAEALQQWEGYIAGLEDIYARIKETHQKIVAVQTARNDRAMSEAARARIDAISREGADISRVYSQRMDEAFKQLQNDRTKNDKERQAEYQRQREQLIREESMALIALYDREIEKVEAAIRASGGKASEEQNRILKDLIDRRRQIEDLAANMPNIEVLPGGTGKQGKSASGFDFDNYLTSLASRLDQAREKVGEMNKELAKFNVLKRMGKFEGIDPAQIARAEAYAKSLDQVNKQVSLLTKSRTQIDDASEGIDRVNAAIEGIEAQARDNNPFIRYAGSITSAKQRLEDFNKALKTSRDDMIAQAAIARKNGETGVAEALENEVARIEALAPKIRIAVGKANAAFATAGGEAMKNELLKIQRAFMTTAEVAASEIQEMNAWIDQLIAEIKRLGQASPELLALAEKLKKAFADSKALENNPFQQLLLSWKDTGAAMKQVMADATSGMADLLTDFIVDGEADFQAFAKSIIKMMVKIMIQAMITRMIMSMIPGMAAPAAGAGAAASSVPTGAQNTLAGNPFAKGGIMTNRGVMALNRYASGGVARRPQVAIFGEGDKPEAFVPLPDGRTIPVTMKQDQASGVSKNGMGDAHINIINQSKEPVQAESSGPRFDGEKFVIDIVLNAISKPGAMRNAVKGAAG